MSQQTTIVFFTQTQELTLWLPMWKKVAILKIHEGQYHCSGTLEGKFADAIFEQAI